MKKETIFPTDKNYHWNLAKNVTAIKTKSYVKRNSRKAYILMFTLAGKQWGKKKKNRTFLKTKFLSTKKPKIQAKNLEKT